MDLDVRQEKTMTPITNPHRNSRRIACSFLFVGQVLLANLDAAIVVSNFTVSSDTIQFELEGSLPNQSPDQSARIIYFANASILDSPGFVLPGSFVAPLSLLGSEALHVSLLDISFPLFTVGTNSWDVFGLNFASELVPGALISGTISAEFPPNTFDPTAVEQINVYWGQADPGATAASISNSIFLDTVIVPEPSSALLVGVSMLGFAIWRHRRIDESNKMLDAKT